MDKRCAKRFAAALAASLLLCLGLAFGAYAADGDLADAAATPAAAPADADGSEAGLAGDGENASVGSIRTLEELRNACNSAQALPKNKLENDITITADDIAKNGPIDVTRTVDINLGDYFIYVDASARAIQNQSVFRIKAGGNLTVNRNYENLALTGGISGKGATVGTGSFSVFLLAENGAQLHLRHNVSNISSSSSIGAVIAIEGKGTVTVDGSLIRDCTNESGTAGQSALFWAKNGTLEFLDGTVSACRATWAVFAAGLQDGGGAGSITIGEKAAIRSSKISNDKAGNGLGAVLMANRGGTVTLKGEVTNCEVLGASGTIAYVAGGGSLAVEGEKALVKDCSCKDEFGVVGAGEKAGGTATADGPAAVFTMTGGSLGAGCTAQAMRGMVYAGRGSQVSITGGTITYMDSSHSGCCLFIAPYGTAKVSNAVLAAPEGGSEPQIAANVQDGGFIHCLGVLAMENCTVDGKHKNGRSVVATHGGIIYAEKLSSIVDASYKCSVTLSGCTLKNGCAWDRVDANEKGQGGAIYCKGASLELRNTTIQTCEAGDPDTRSANAAAGAGLYLTGAGTALLADSSVRDCEILGVGSGAGIWVGGGASVRASNCTVEGNKAAKGYGGGICAVADAKASALVTTVTLDGKTTVRDNEAKEAAYAGVFLDYLGESAKPAQETNDSVELAVQGLAEGSAVRVGISPEGLSDNGKGNRSISGGYSVSAYIELGAAGQQRVLRQDYRDLVVTTADKILKTGADIENACKNGGEYFLDNDIVLSADEVKQLPAITGYVKISTGSHWLVPDTSARTPFILNGDSASLVFDSDTSGDAAGGLRAPGAKAAAADAAADADTADADTAEAADAAEAAADTADADAADTADDENAVCRALIRIDKGTCTVHAAVKGFTCNDYSNSGIVYIPQGSDTSSLVCDGAVITGCKAPGSSLIVARAGTVKVTGGRIEGAAQAARGSCVAVYGNVRLTIEGATLVAASGGIDGGCLYLGEGSPTLDMRKCTLTGTKVDGDGGAIYAANGTASIADTTISRGSATNGGAIYASNLQALTISGASRITNCTAVKSGGAVYFESDKAQARLSLQGSATVARNTAAAGAGIAFGAGGTSAVSFAGTCSVFNNFAAAGAETSNLYLFARAGTRSVLDALLDAAGYPLEVAESYAGVCGVTVDAALAKTWPYTLAKITRAAARGFAADSSAYETAYDTATGTLLYRPLAANGSDPTGDDPALGSGGGADAASGAGASAQAGSAETGDLPAVALVALAGCAVCALVVCAATVRRGRETGR